MTNESSWADALHKVVGERDALKEKLATARNDALYEAAEEVLLACIGDSNRPMGTIDYTVVYDAILALIKG